MYLWLPYHPIYPYMLYLPIPNLSISCPLSISLSIYLSIYPSIHPSIYPSIHLSIFLFVCLSIDLSINLSIYQSIYLYLRNWKYVYINIYLPRSLSIHLFYLFYRIHRNYQIYPFFRFSYQFQNDTSELSLLCTNTSQHVGQVIVHGAMLKSYYEAGPRGRSALLWTDWCAGGCLEQPASKWAEVKRNCPVLCFISAMVQSLLCLSLSILEHSLFLWVSILYCCGRLPQFLIARYWNIFIEWMYINV